MAYQATVIPVMIASPSDVPNERKIIRDVINDWNYINAQSRRAVLMPTGWETHSAPELGNATAQELINTRILAHCDLLVGVFWTRLGTPTGKAASGTAEEIERHIEAGKPALVYFSSAPVIPDVFDHEQYSALLEFKKWCAQRGIIQVYNDLEQFKGLFINHLALELNQNDYVKNLIGGDANPVEDGFRNVSISAEGVQILLAASEDSYGIIMRVEHSGGLLIQAGGRAFGNAENHREMSKWDQALNDIANFGLIRDKGYKREVFELTNAGYEAVEKAKEQGMSLPPIE